MKPTTDIVMIIGTTAMISDRKLGMSATTPEIMGYRVELRSKSAIYSFTPFYSQFSQNTVIVTTLTTAYKKVCQFSDVKQKMIFWFSEMLNCKMCALEVLKKEQVGGFHFYFAPMEAMVRALPPAYAWTVANHNTAYAKCWPLIFVRNNKRAHRAHSNTL